MSTTDKLARIFCLVYHIHITNVTSVATLSYPAVSFLGSFPIAKLFTEELQCDERSNKPWSQKVLCLNSESGTL